jgi:hypothetical protein
MVFGCYELLVYTDDYNVIYVLSIGFLSSSLIYLSIFSILPGGFLSLKEYCSYGLMLYERKKK